MTQSTEAKEGAVVAFFDFDGTLTTGDTLMPFLKYVLGRRKYYAKLFLVSPILVAYFAKVLRNDIAKQMVLKQFLSGYHVDELLSLGERFSEEVIPTMLRPEGMEKLRWHQQQGHECVLVSASLDIYLESWARKERLTAVLCTSLKKKNNGDVTGEIEGENCYGEEKVRRIKGWHKGKPAKNTYAYGDTSGDLPMIKSARQGYLWTKQENRFVANHRAS